MTKIMVTLKYKKNLTTAQRCVLLVSFRVDLLKVRQSRNDFYKAMFLPKKRTNEFDYYDTSGRLVFFIFWKKFKTPKLKDVSKLTDLYYGSNKSTGKVTSKMHLCALY